MRDARSDTANGRQPLAARDLARQLLGSVAGVGQAPSGEIQRVDDLIELSLPGRLDGRQACDIIDLECFFDARDVT